MKRSIAIFVFILIAFQVPAQQNLVDSLMKKLEVAEEDTSKIKLLNKLANIFSESKPDSTLFYANQALELSKKTNYPKGEINALSNLVAGLTFIGNYSQAIDNALQALRKSEAIKDDRLMAFTLVSIGSTYAIQENFQLGIPYQLKANDIYKKIQDSLNLCNGFVNVGWMYGRINKLDSARIFQNQAIEIALRLKNESLVSAAYMNLGIVNLNMKNYEIGISYSKMPLPYYKANNNHLFLSSIYNVLGNLFDSTGHRDSAFYYSRLSLYHAKEMGSPQLLLYSTKQLSALFKESHNLDSAFIYHEMATTAKDSLTNQEKQRQVQALTFNEQLRQIEIAKQKENQAAARKRNLQLAGIAIFIPVFLFIVLLLGRKKIKSRTVEYLGVIALLFLFEFIVLFAHPYIGHWTHESPIWMLLILVAVAAILVPLHHRSETWIKKKLGSK